MVLRAEEKKTTALLEKAETGSRGLGFRVEGFRVEGLGLTA